MATVTVWCFKILVILGLSIFSYWNSLQGELCFDDMFAVLYNGDTSPDQPYLPLWQHDFWGHDISLNESHKSYRPITITYFRLIRQYTLSIYNENPDAFLINNLTMKEKGIHPEYIHREKDLQPFYLHFGNMLIHSFNSILIMILIMLLFHHENQYNKDLSFISALLFATHPVHVEAVTGIVGAAELLSCFFGLLSFFCYIFAHSAYFDENNLYKSFTSNSFVAFIFWCGCCSIFYYLSALSKETGVTISALMILYSIFKFWQQLMICYNMENKPRRLSIYKQLNFYFNIFIHFILLLIPILWLISYLRLRQYLAGAVMAVGHEVFRRTENPVAFASDFITRLLTIPYLHYYYLSLLIYPHPLSADYSFNCIPMIESIDDYRNIFSIITYLIIFICLIWSAFKILYSICIGIDNHIHFNKYWNIIVIFAWMIVPFMPASNLFFFVATFIAERLLYLPSIGFCILFSYILIHIIPNYKNNKLWLWCIVGIIISLYIFKTNDRNNDWLNEETLFESAYKVCPNSVKVLQNSAILDRRYLRFEESLEKLYRAKEIDDTFCTADHWIGVTLVNKGQIMKGLQLLKKSLDCKFALKDTAQSLQKLFQMLLQWSPNNPVFTHEWGSILYRLQQKDNEQGAYFYLQQSLNQFILGSMKKLMAGDEDEDDEIDNVTKEPSVFANKLDVAERMEDILDKLSEEYKYGPMDCFHKLAQIIIDYYRIYYRIEKLSFTKKFDDFYEINDMVSTPEANKNRKRKQFEKVNKKKIRKKKKKKLKGMESKDRKIFYKKNLLLSLKYLAEIAWKSIVNEEDCKQEMENNDVASWQNTWNYFTLNIVESILNIKDSMDYNLRKYYNETDNKFWDELATQHQAMQKLWNQYQSSLDYSQLSREQRDILMATTKSGDKEIKNKKMKNKQKKRKKKKGKNKKRDLLDIDPSECELEMQNRYNLLQEKLKDKSREDHFWALVSLKEQIDETLTVLKYLVESDICDLKVKIWSLDGMAIILTPYIKQDKNEWNFEGLLEDETLIRRIRETGKGIDVDPTIKMIAALYPYLQDKMKQLGVTDHLRKK